MIVGIPLDRNDIVREVELIFRRLCGNGFIVGEGRISISVFVMETDRAKANFIKIDVAVQMPRRLVRSVVVDSTRSHFQASRLAGNRPTDIFQFDAVDAIQVNVAGVLKSVHDLLVIITRSHIAR